MSADNLHSIAFNLCGKVFSIIYQIVSFLQMSGQMSSFAEQKQQVTAATFAAKFQSKREVYLLLTLDASAYLCDHKCVTI